LQKTGWVKKGLISRQVVGIKEPYSWRERAEKVDKQGRKRRRGAGEGASSEERNGGPSTGAETAFPTIRKKLRVKTEKIELAWPIRGDGF